MTPPRFARAEPTLKRAMFHTLLLCEVLIVYEKTGHSLIHQHNQTSL
jgi:hypothetical protein